MYGAKASWAYGNSGSINVIVMVPFGREESQFGSHRVMASDHPRIVILESTSRYSLPAIGGSIGKYSDRTYWKSAARSAPRDLTRYRR
jgi:hypothetical protein